MEAILMQEAHDTTARVDIQEAQLQSSSARAISSTRSSSYGIYRQQGQSSKLVYLKWHNQIVGIVSSRTSS
jgi:hypothetical protein